MWRRLSLTVECLSFFADVSVNQEATGFEAAEESEKQGADVGKAQRQ